jgi:hypothetical protein
MTNKLKIFTAFSLLILIIIGLLGFLYVPTFHNNDSLIYSKFEFAETDDKCPIPAQDYCLPRDRKYQIVPLDSNWQNPLNPTFSIVFAYKEGVGQDGNSFRFSNVVVIKLKRDNIFDFNYKFDKVIGNNSTKNLTFEKVIELAKSNDLYNNNLDKVNIRNIPPLTQSEIESNSKLREQEQQNLQTQEEFNNKSVIERQQICFEILERIKNDLQNAKNGNFTNTEPSQKQTKEEYIAITEPSIPDLEKTCNELK